jgi:hypothetical protein
MARAYSVNEIQNKKYNVIPWSEPWKAAFHQPETTGVVYIGGKTDELDHP